MNQMTKVEVYTLQEATADMAYSSAYFPCLAHGQYKLIVRGVDKDSSFIQAKLALQRILKTGSSALNI